MVHQSEDCLRTFLPAPVSLEVQYQAPFVSLPPARAGGFLLYRTDDSCGLKTSAYNRKQDVKFKIDRMTV